MFALKALISIGTLKTKNTNYTTTKPIIMELELSFQSSKIKFFEKRRYLFN